MLREPIDIQDKQSEQTAIDAEKAYRSARTLMPLFGTLALLASDVAAFLITRGLVKQPGAMKAMRDSPASIVVRVHASTDTIATALSQIASGNLDLSSRTEQQASSLEETASSMQELTSTVKQSADNARQANSLTLSASEVAVKGGAVVAQVVALTLQ